VFLLTATSRCQTNSANEQANPQSLALSKEEAAKLDAIKQISEENPTSIPRLIRLLKDPSSIVRAAAADKLGQIDYENTSMQGNDKEQDLREVEPLIHALQDSRALVRAAAAESLGQIMDARAVRPLMALLKDAKPKVLIAATLALKQMAGEGFEHPNV